MHYHVTSISLTGLLPLLDDLLIDLLKSLSPEEWRAQTVAKHWKVKDAAAHLLDGNIRVLSMLRDGYQGESSSVSSYQDLVDFLNGLNADWVKAMKRVSPQVLILLHELTGKAYCEYYASLDPMEKAVFPVAWAGESESLNWMHIAREYTEKWLHQQQIREAVNRPALMAPMYLRPFIQVCMYALPYTFRDVKAKKGTIVAVTVTGDAESTWPIVYDGEKWYAYSGSSRAFVTEVIIGPDLAWKLFSKSLRPADAGDQVIIKGNRELGEVAAGMVSFMA
ncbi:maleylpyruvate isomerase N-terminal domain-containing protein [Hufsiella ginkgonis]|uniref:Mycothiol-dependent maleylpyruvate isomerase metal-binding domain-containing protein n=1 Tax=Hufsiella ginkgonis TaxID=2695274 RepID=A0A7K1XWX6_9SPHI|nr:maleylpyruvate isomerase N-terminal domain-containing protein [Hufsiella ginkgonis]MXV15298.1 hypothetical protein [Hufsiella ginkgonis]